MGWKFFSKVFPRQKKQQESNTIPFSTSEQADIQNSKQTPLTKPVDNARNSTLPKTVKTTKQNLSPASIYISCFYLMCCCLATLNLLILSFWLFFFYSLKNDWRDITEAITGYVTGISLPYSIIIWIMIWILWAYSAFIVYYHPIQKFWITSWRPRSRSTIIGNGPTQIHMSMGLINILFNLIIAVVAIAVAPTLLFLYGFQFFMAPVRLLETILPPIFLVAQLFYGLAGLPALIMWSSAISRAARHNPMERSPACSCSLRAIRIFSLLIIGACILWGGAVFFSSLPLWFDSAHFLPDNELPSKPKLFAHRGLTEAGYPENSISSMKAALEHEDVFGIETDISISFDGIPFCLHDKLLIRTTNIKSVFPDRISEPAESFNMDELEQLFLLGSEEEKIPTFKVLLELLVNYPNKRLIFDLRTPSYEDHPYKDNYQDVMKSVIGSVSSASSQIVLLNMDRAIENAFPKTPTATNYEVVDLISDGGKAAKKKASSIKLGNGNDSLPAPSSRGLNLEYLVSTSAIREVRGLEPPTRSLKAWKKGWSGLIKEVKASFSSDSKSTKESEVKPFWMCMYALSESHLYSQAWCLGVDAVIANSIEKFGGMTEPIWWIPQSKMHYYPLIGFIGGAIFLLWVIIFILLVFFGILKSLISCVSSVLCCCVSSTTV